jgi:hypothetical protein
MQLEAAELINQDGYYDTIKPIDDKEEIEESMKFDWRIPAVITGGLLLIAIVIYVSFNYL